MKALVAHDWPGNIRGLQQAVVRLLIEADGASTMTPDHADESLSPPKASHRRPSQAEILAELQQQEKPNISALARKFGMSRTTIHGYMKCAAAIATAVATEVAR
jgi:transcriptional regulator of acetoin/glycerol metabolism